MCHQIWVIFCMDASSAAAGAPAKDAASAASQLAFRSSVHDCQYCTNCAGSVISWMASAISVSEAGGTEAAPCRAAPSSATPASPCAASREVGASAARTPSHAQIAPRVAD